MKNSNYLQIAWVLGALLSLRALAVPYQECIAKQTLRGENLGSNEITSETSHSSHFAATREGHHNFKLQTVDGNERGEAKVYVRHIAARGNAKPYIQLEAYFEVLGHTEMIGLDVTAKTPMARAHRLVETQSTRPNYSEVYTLTLECHSRQARK